MKRVISFVYEKATILKNTYNIHTKGTFSVKHYIMNEIYIHV